MSDDLAAFLRARLGEDERVARAVTARQPIDEWDAIGAAGEDEAARSHWGVGSIARAEPTPAARDISVHIARWDPARVLAEVEVKRAIVDRYEHAATRADNERDPGIREEWEVIASTYEGVLATFALPHTGHPDYRDEWKP